MDIKQLEAFVYVLETRSFSRAGELLHLTQPTISAHIAALEQETNVKLVIRNSSNISPSEAGRILYSYAKKILDTREEAMNALYDFSHTMKGTVTIAASSIPGQFFLPKLMQRFREKYPDVIFDLQITDSEDVIHKIAGRTADVGFSGTMIENKKCVFKTFASDQLVIITPAEDRFRPYIQTGILPVEQVLNEPFINREKGSGTRKETEAFLKHMNIDTHILNTAVSVHSTESIIRMVSEGLGIAVISKNACLDYCSFHKIFSFNLGNDIFERKLYVIRHRSSILSPVAQVFYDYAKSFYNNVLP